ncbi:MAG: hypothetical protein ACE5JL_15960 [Dehalococcoidia bacterium]
MSDLLLVVSSEFFGALLGLVKDNGWTWKTSGDRWGEWYPGEEKESLQSFLDRTLENMVYDDHGHIVTAVTRVDLETRCPYPPGGGRHEDCLHFCNRCERELTSEELERALASIPNHKFGKTRPWWTCPDCWEPEEE